MLDRALPALRKCSQLLRAWTEESWRGQGGGAEWRRQRVYPAALALGTALVYALYAALYAAHAAVLWATEPLGADDERRRDADAGLAALTDYDEDAPGVTPTGNT
ncbi:hypothetical protein HF086_011877 [Spodoptera exigua]|uniref:Uncharacterized protein n=1 Tax=Spodoptera exigua TaxID=7107 RepID=A0A922M9M8_SPOEX|nr:hypothetical protein HF086_011877 [Spodoptera exigua]